MQEIKDAIVACRQSGFQDTAAASVAGGLAKANAAASHKDVLPEPKSLKTFDALSEPETSSSDDEDTST